MAEINVFTEDDVRKLLAWRDSIRKVQANRRQDLQADRPPDQNFAICFVKTPTDGIPELSGDDVGHAECPLYRLDFVTDAFGVERKLVPVLNPDDTPQTEIIYNPYTKKVNGGVYVMVWRNARGEWMTENPTGDIELNQSFSSCGECSCFNCTGCLPITTCSECVAAPEQWIFNTGGLSLFRQLAVDQLLSYVSGCIWETAETSVTLVKQYPLPDCPDPTTSTTTTTTEPPEETGGYKWRFTLTGTGPVLQLLHVSGDDPIGITRFCSLTYSGTVGSCNCESRVYLTYPESAVRGATCSICVAPVHPQPTTTLSG